MAIVFSLIIIVLTLLKVMLLYRSGTKTMEKGPGRVSPAAEAAGLSLNNADPHANANNGISAEDKEDS